MFPPHQFEAELLLQLLQALQLLLQGIHIGRQRALSLGAFIELNCQHLLLGRLGLQFIVQSNLGFVQLLHFRHQLRLLLHLDFLCIDLACADQIEAAEEMQRGNSSAAEQQA